MSIQSTLDGEHRYQIGSMPVYLSIGMVDGAPRLSFIVLKNGAGVPYTPPLVVHAATFRGEHHAATVVRFLDEMMNNVNEAVAFHLEAAKAMTGVTVTHPTEPKDANEN